MGKKKTKTPKSELLEYAYVYFFKGDEFYLANKGLIEDIIYHKLGEAGKMLEKIVQLENLQGVFICKKQVNYKDIHFPEKKQSAIAKKYQGRFCPL